MNIVFLFFLLNHKHFPISISILLYNHICRHLIVLFATYCSNTSRIFQFQTFEFAILQPGILFATIYQPMVSSFSCLSNITLQKSLPGELHLNNVFLYAVHSSCILHRDTKRHLTSYVVYILS